jgi:putative inorganic carbon (HCO3(-)) transporter
LDDRCPTINNIYDDKMKDIDLNSATNTDTGSKLTAFRLMLTRRQLYYAAFIMISLLCAVMLNLLPFSLQLVMIAVVPAFLIVIAILRDPIYGIYFCFFYDYLRPYDFIPALLPLRLSMVIEIVTLISWLHYITERRETLKWSRFNFLYLGFIAVVAITVVLAINHHLAFNTLQLLVINFVMYMIATNRIDSVKKLDKLILLLLLILTYFSIKGIINFSSGQYDYGSKRTSGFVAGSFLNDENDFALALNFIIPFAYFFFIEKSKGIKKYFSLGILIILVLGVIASGSRGGWIGLMAAIFCCLLLSKRKALSLVITGLLAAVIVLFAPAKYWQGVASISHTNEGTAQSRINYWKAGVRMFLDHPIIGVGAANGPIRMSEYVTGFADINTQWGRTFHGTFPQVMAELGSAGLLLYLAMIFFVLKHLRKLIKADLGEDKDGVKSIAKAIIGSMMAYLVTATFLSSAYYPQIWTLYVFTTILIFVAKPKNKEFDRRNPY